MAPHHKRNDVYCDWDDVLTRARRQSIVDVKIEINQYGTVECVLEDVDAAETTTIPEASKIGQSDMPNTPLCPACMDAPASSNSLQTVKPTDSSRAIGI